MNDPLADLSDAPEHPDHEGCEALLGELTRLCASGGWERFARPPVVPGVDAFPDPWQATPLGVATVARRLIAHAGIDDLRVVVADRRRDAGGVVKKVPTELELVSVDGGRARLDLFSIGDDDIAGTIAHEIGAAVAARWDTPDAPYRGVAASAIDHDARWRGSVAAVYLGLGVCAANASFQQYSSTNASIGYAPVDYDVVQAGHLTVDELGFLLAVQAVVRGDDQVRGLGGVQADVMRAWRTALAGRGAALRAMLGVPSPDLVPDVARAAPAPLPDEPEDALVIAESASPARRVYRIPNTRGGLGMMIGIASLGVVAVAAGGKARAFFGSIAGGGALGYAVGRRVKVERCSACVDLLPSGAVSCPHCGGQIAGLLASRADALDAD